MLLLGIETASDVCAVALMDGDRLVAEAALHVPRSHAAHLVPLVRDVLARAGAAAADLAAVAVSAGPGSFTGLRIGVSTAKGLCLASGAALVAVPTLRALAERAGPLLTAIRPGDLLVAALPSRRGEVFAAAFELDLAAGLVPASPAAAVPYQTLAAWARPAARTWAVGPVAEEVAAALQAAGGPDVRAAVVAPSAVPVARLGRSRLVAGLTEDAAAFEPDYVTPAYVGAAPFAVTADPGGTGAAPGLS
jgi:tRNA threonylcarbamoyladenosine biosynthesis protein TsaB